MYPRSAPFIRSAWNPRAYFVTNRVAAHLPNTLSIPPTSGRSPSNGSQKTDFESISSGSCSTYAYLYESLWKKKMSGLMLLCMSMMVWASP